VIEETAAEDTILETTFPPSEVVEAEQESGEEVADDPLLQEGLFGSYQTRPLTPIGRCLDIGHCPTLHKTVAGRFEEVSFPYSDHYYIKPLLAHAHLYEFATYHILPSLQQFTIQRLIQLLTHVDCSMPHAVPELAELTRFVYSHTSPVTNEVPIRKVISHFAAINYTCLMKGEFKELFSEGGDFTVDLGQKISRRLLASGGSTQELEQEIEELEARLHQLETQRETQTREVKRLNNEIREWQNYGRGTSSKRGRKRGGLV